MFNMLGLIGFLLLSSIFGADKQCLCPPGFFHISAGQCAPCKPGTFQSNYGKTFCKPCPPNTISEEGSTMCERCGKHSIASRNTATKCACKPRPYGPIRFRFTYRQYAICQIRTCPFGSAPQYPKHGHYAFCGYCDAGFFAFVRSDGTSVCRICPKGSYSFFNSTSCTRCPGERMVAPGICAKECPAGMELLYDRFLKPARRPCTECSRGTFKKRPGNFKCQRCPKGSYSERNSTACASCPKGFRPLFSYEDNTTICGICPEGTYYNEHDNVCVSCEEGFYKAKSSFGKCLKCASGSYSFRGAVKCVTCPPGKALMKDGDCKSCAPGFYYCKYSGSCIRCYENSYSPGGIIENCIQCKKKQFSRKGASGCSKCSEGTAYNYETGRCGLCPAGRFVQESSNTCEPCYDGITTGPNLASRCTPCPRGEVALNKGTVCGRVCKVKTKRT